MKSIATYCLLIFLFISNGILGQNNYVVEIHFSKKPKELRKLNNNISVFDSLASIKEISKTLTSIQSLGYAEVQIDSSKYSKNKVDVFLYLGPKYQWKSLAKGNADWTSLGNISYHYQDFENENFNFNEFQAFQEAIITSLENSGYPFASISLDSIEIIDNQISAQLDINKGNYISIDTIILADFNSIRMGFIEQSLGISNGDPYDESKVKKINEKLNRLDFARISKESEIIFSEDKAKLILHLKNKSSNQFDGIVGFQPASDNSKQLIITGNVRLNLNNVFKHGEMIKLNWESPGNQSQSLDLSIKYPYLFNSPFGIAFDFNLDKRDTSFLNVNTTPAIQFAWNSSNYLSAYANFFSSKSLGASQITSFNNGILDMHSNAFGLELHINHLDYPFNPRKGYFINTKIEGGYKVIDQVSDIDESLYDSISLQDFRFAGKLNLAFYIPLHKRHTILLANKTAWIKTDDILVNELYRIGGFMTLRGFDEQSIFAEFYSISTLEYHYLLNQNSFLGAFWDVGQVVNSYPNTQTGIYQGFGVNFSFATQAGIFKLAYALGKTEGNNIEFRNAKIHFGYTSLF